MSRSEHFVGATTYDLRVSTGQGEMFVRQWTPVASASHLIDLSPVVLFHDSLGCVALWKDLPELLCVATGRKIIAYDRLGYGRSDKHRGKCKLTFIEDQAKHFFPCVKEALQIERFVVLGHSVGGAMATLCAGHFPEDCQALVTLSAQAFVEENTQSGIRQAQQLFASPDVIQKLEAYHGSKASWALNAWFEIWLSSGFAGWQIEDHVSELSFPVLAIHGHDDEYGSSVHPLRYIALTNNEQRLILLSNCKHFPHREHPGKVISAVSDFLRYIN